MSIETRERLVHTPQGSVRALILDPVGDVVLGRDRLHRLRAQQAQSPIDREILDAVADCGGEIALTVFCARNTLNGGSWSFAPDLEVPETEELAALLIVSQMRTYLAMFQLGVCLHIRVDFGPEQSAFRGAQADLAAAVERAERGEGPSPFEGSVPADLARFVLSEMFYCFSRSLDELLNETLPPRLDVLQRRAERMRAQLGDLDETQPIFVDPRLLRRITQR